MPNDMTKGAIPLGLFDLVWRNRHVGSSTLLTGAPSTTPVTVAVPTPLALHSTRRVEVSLPTNVPIQTGRACPTPYIRERVALISGKTFDEVRLLGVTYVKPCKGQSVPVPYTYEDYKYDVRRRWIVIDTPGTAPDSAQFVAWCKLREEYETACHVYSGDEPLNQRQAKLRPDAAEWVEAEDQEMHQLSSAGMACYELVDKAEAEQAVASGAVKKIYRSRFVYKAKPACNGQPARKKARCVATDYNSDSPAHDVFAPVARPESIRLLCSLAAQHDWDIVQIDINNAFVTAPLESPEYVLLPDDWKLKYPGKVMKVSTALYGFTFSPRVFYRHLSKTFLAQTKQFGFRRSDGDGSVYVRRDELGTCIVAVWVDDLTIFGDPPAVAQFRKAIADVENGGFQVRDYGEPTSILGLELRRDRAQRLLQLTQTLFIETLAERFGIPTESPRTPFPINAKVPDFDPQLPEADATQLRALVGSLLWVTNHTRPDCAYHVKELSKHLAKCNQVHIDLARNVASFLRYTSKEGLLYDGKLASGMEGYSDSDWAASTNRRSTTGYVFVCNGAAISWRSKTQRYVAYSSTEAEFRSCSDAVREALFLPTIWASFTDAPLKHPTLIHEDNQGCIAWSHNAVDFVRSKHIETSVCAVREHVQEFKTVKLQYIPTSRQLADILTKNTVPATFQYLRQGLLGLKKRIFG